MEDKEIQELEEFSLEDIIKEFSDHPHAVPAEEEIPAQDAEEEVVPQEAPVEAEMHMKGMTSIIPDSCIFPYIEEH